MLTLTQPQTKKAIGFCFLLYLAILLGFVVPMHHHKDGMEHSDCVVCIISHQPIITPIIASVFIAILHIFIKAPRFCKALHTRIPLIFHSRAPPLM